MANFFSRLINNIFQSNEVADDASLSVLKSFLNPTEVSTEKL